MSMENLELQIERQTLREEILSVGKIIAEYEMRRHELNALTTEYQDCQDVTEKATIAMKVMDLRLSIDADGANTAELEARITTAFDQYDNALMDALIDDQPQPTSYAAANGFTAQAQQPRSQGFAPITNKCPLCDGYKRAEFDFCRDCYMRRNPEEFDTCQCGRTKHVRYEMCGTCHFEEQSRFA